MGEVFWLDYKQNLNKPDVDAQERTWRDLPFTAYMDLDCQE